MSDETTRIKICGLRSADAAVAASNAGADYLGFNFVDGVRRQLQPDQGAQIVSDYKRNRDSSNPPGLVGLFRNQNVDWVNETSAGAGLDYVQLCGDEDDKYIAQMQLPIFRQVRVKQGTGPIELGKIVAPHLDADRIVILDHYSEVSYGGSGLSFEWAAAEGVANRDRVMLAGGLTPENVGSAIARLSPWGVDVASGVETDGVKDPDRIRAFISAVQNA
ncbi:phosphoribosylanthranilate isomerase [SAR202 cluster bacterium AD-812-D07_MRT_10900m]|nr:phosphoribosylanthranilate isomerase [SAR202 cluster bacterium AD-812-D07_MRT_10900m]